jgi:hypothetical protein
MQDNIIYFDVAIRTFPAYTGYYGNPPQDASQYAVVEWIQPWDFPTWEEVEVAMDEVKKKQCKEQASALLYDTDWTTIPDVANPENTPYLTNQADFIAYRNTVRQLAVNPVPNPTFPTKPTEVWG